MTTIEDIVSDSSWYPHHIDLDAGELTFLKTSASDLSAASFLDQRFSPSGAQSLVVKIDQVLERQSQIVSTQPRYIFHTAFCCSTLLARCLDYPTSTVALKEPQILMALANYKRTKHAMLSSSASAAKLYGLISSLLFRPMMDSQGNAQEVLIKPTNTVNNIIEELLAVSSHSTAILLHSDLESFLVSLLKKGEEGRAFGRNLFNIYQMDSIEAQQMSTQQLMRMTDLQIGAISWHLQFENFVDALARSTALKLKSLHCDRLLAQPEEILARSISLLRLPALEKEFDQLILRAPLQVNAKSPKQPFSSKDRKAQHADIRTIHADSLSIIIPWAKQLRFKHAFTNQLSNVL